MDKNTSDEFFGLVGRTIAVWSGLESQLCNWFISLLNGYENGTYKSLWRVFNSGKNFNTKKDMLQACVDGLPPNSMSKFLNASIKKASQYSTFRNKVAHDLYIGAYSEGEYKVQIQPHKSVFEIPNPITAESLKLANVRISALLQTMFAVSVKSLTPQEGLERVEALPNEADHPLDSPTPPKKKQRGQGKLRPHK